MKVMAGDVGGTKTLLQIAEVGDGRIEVLHQEHFLSQEYPDFESLLRDYLADVPAALCTGIDSACFGVAGPISDAEQGNRRARVTNLPWDIAEAKLRTLLQVARVRLINDFCATASGIAVLGPDDLAVLNPGSPQARAPRLVIGAGTGLGVAQLLWSEGRYRAFPSEGGHIHFAPTDALQMELLAYLQKRYGRVAYERVVSGGGLVNIYSFLHQRAQDADPANLQSILASPDSAAAITALAHADDPLARQAVSLFVSIYGAIAGDLALLTLAHGGVYVAGGIAPKLLHEMHAGMFMEAYLHKGRMSSLVKQMPVFIVLAKDVGVLGATLVAFQL